MEAHCHTENQSERAERACEELAEVVAGHVLDHLPARFRDRAVGECHRDPDHEVARRPVAVAKRPGVSGRDDPPDRRSVPAPERWVECEHLARLGEHVLDVLEPCARLEDGRQVAGIVLADRRERGRRDVQIGAGCPTPPSFVPPPTGRTARATSLLAFRSSAASS